jgi:hypothetical protein
VIFQVDPVSAGEAMHSHGRRSSSGPAVQPRFNTRPYGAPVPFDHPGVRWSAGRHLLAAVA